MTTIVTKNSSTASSTPSSGDLVKGELAINVTDKKVYTKDNSAAIVKIVGSLGNQEANAVAITGGSIAGITDLAIADGGTGQSTANAAFNALAPAQTGNSGKYLTTNGTDTSWATNPLGTVTSVDVSGGTTGLTTSGGPVSTSGTITLAGTLAVANGGTGVTTSTGTGSVVLSSSPTLVTPALGTPSALVGTNITGTASGLTAGSVTTNANLTGAVTSVGNATSLGSFTSAQLATALSDETGSGSAVFATSPTLVTPVLGTPTSGNFSTGTFTWPTFNQNTTGTAANITASSNSTLTTLSSLSLPGSQVSGNISGNAANVTGTVGTTNGGTGLTSFTANGVVYASSTSALATGSALTFDGTNLAIGASPTFYGGQVATAGSIAITGGSLLKLWNTGGTGVGGISSPGTDTLSFSVGSGFSEQMRLTSTGLGIGNSSPTAKLDVTGTAAISGAVTLSGGTANGVPYLNGSKVLTTGSALTFSQSGGAFSTTFNINSLLGSANYKGGIVVTEDDAAFTLYGGSGYKLLETQGYSTPSALKFYANNTEQMRLTSTGLGIGTSSPNRKLEVAGSTNAFAGFNATSYRRYTIGSESQGFVIYDDTASAYRIILDSAGNLGLGVTANASAIFDAQSTTKGVRMPNMTTTQKNAISSPAAGLMVFDTTLAKLCVYTGAAWQTITSI